MNGFKVLFSFGMKRRMKDSFIIGYSVIFPLFLIGVLGYIASGYFSGNGEINSFKYYTLVLIPLSILMGMITIAYVAKEENTFRVSYRFITAPLNVKEIVIAKLLTSTIAMSLWNIIVLTLCKFLFKINFNGRFIEIGLLLTAETFMTVSLGIFIGLCTKNFMMVKNLLNIPIMIFGILGGAFFPVGSLGKIFNVISYISPLIWINRGLILMIYDNNMFLYLGALIITITIGGIFTVGSIRFFKKEAFL